MKKLLLSALAIALTLTAIPQFVLAGGIENKQNFSARYTATGSRNAAIDGADIAAYNPAGIMMKEDNGFLFQVDVQYILKDYEHDVDNTDFNND
ncbi:MAG: long-chain fatty acid transport protein, partial [Desulfobacteraceae bacterium]